MDVDTAIKLSSIGQIIAAFASTCGLFFVGWQLQQTRKSADLDTLQLFVKSVTEHERSLLSSKNPVEKEQLYIDFLNFLEIYALSLQNGLLPSLSREVITDKLVDALALIWVQPELKDQLEDAITSPNTFSGLHCFIKGNRTDIEKRSAA